MQVVLRRVVPGAVHLQIRRDHAEGELLDGRADRDARRAGLRCPERLLERLRGDLVDVGTDHGAPLVTQRVVDPLEHSGLHGGVRGVARAGEGHGALGGAEPARVPPLLHARDEVRDETHDDDVVQPVLEGEPQVLQGRLGIHGQIELRGQVFHGFLHALQGQRREGVLHRARWPGAVVHGARLDAFGDVFQRVRAPRASREWGFGHGTFANSYNLTAIVRHFC